MADNKNNNERNVPPLRFPEFCGEWECTSIGNIGEIKNGPFGSVLHAEDYVEEGIPIVTTEHFKTGLMPSDKFGIPQVSNEDYIRLKGYRLETNDIVFSRVGSVDINAHVGIEQNGWLFSGRVLRVRPKHDVDSLFLHYALSTEAVKRDIRNRAVGQTMPSINTPILSSTTIRLPKELSEQKKVAHFLRLLDERIATQNKIIEKLQSLIKGIAQNIVLRNKPNMHISQCLECSSSTLQESDVLEYGTYPVYGANGVVGYLDNYGTQSEAVYIIKDGSGVGAVSYVTGKCSATGTLNVLQAKEGFSLQYLYYLLKVFNFEPYKTGMAIPHIYFKDYGKARIFCPSYSEQLKCAKFLSTIDDKLLAEQNVLINLSLQKQYLLRQMFI
ncbi:restriction endonuclease subunit S [Bacteroides fragilis]|uniref:restriction endonuclease subunit S n=3 Tax=Bacteroides fragilis TaxID=817 RepID=UPI0039B50DB5